MPRIAIISDIHANNQALSQVLRDIEKRNVAEIIKLDYKDTLRTVYFDMVNSHNIGNALSSTNQVSKVLKSIHFNNIEISKEPKTRKS